MPNVSGFVYYSVDSTFTPTSGIANVPVAIYNTSDGNGAVALTDATGAYQFTNVPAGTYKLIETWGTTGAPTPVNYASATAMPIPPEVEPPLSALSIAYPALADKLNAITPNMINITVAGDLTNQNFIDAPVGNKPITFTGVTAVGPNLITAASNGTWGDLPAGSLADTIPATDPYPGVTPGFPFVATPQPTDGTFTVMNTRNTTNPAFNWWQISDHTTGIETSRFILVNGDNPQAKVFTQSVTVEPNTQYVFTGWVMNILNVDSPTAVKPQFSFQVIAPDNSVLGYELLNSIAVTPIPVWYENGFIFNSGNNTTVTVNVLSEGVFSRNGNDFVIDDLTLYKAIIGDAISVKKEATPDIIFTTPATDITFTSTVTNEIATTPVTNVFFQDILDPTLQFVTGSITVNGSPIGFETADPNIGFSLGNFAGAEVKVVEFHATTLAGPSPVQNIASATYDAAASGNGDFIRQTVNSNIVYLKRMKYDLTQASVDITQSVALEQTGLSHIINAEGEKIQAALAVPGITPEQLIEVNASVETMINSIKSLELIFQSKIKSVSPQIIV